MWSSRGYGCFVFSLDALCISVFSSASARGLHGKLTHQCPEVDSLEQATSGTGNPWPLLRGHHCSSPATQAMPPALSYSLLTLTASRTCFSMISTEIRSQKLKLLYNYNSCTTSKETAQQKLSH